MKDQRVSVILPVRNEEENLETLMLRINRTMRSSAYDYEVIAIDDYSQDGSLVLLKKLSQEYPIRVYQKEGPIGKGSSILEGIIKSDRCLLVILDADLAYPPEVIPELLSKLDKNDVVVGERIYINGERRIKKLLAYVFRRFFGQSVFALDLDVQSGMKAFKKEVVDSLELNPAKWSFDLEFLLKASHAGYRLASFPVEYGSRKKGTGKMNLLLAGVELMLASLRFWILPFKPFKPVKVTNGGIAPAEIGWKKQRYQPYTELDFKDSAIETVLPKQWVALSAMALLLTVLTFYSWHLTLVVIISALSVLYFMDLLFNLYLIVISLRRDPAISVSYRSIAREKRWPKYTIICPLYKEAEVLPHFVKAIQNINYPKDRLEVLLVLEEDDLKTRIAAGAMHLPRYFEKIIVPESDPKTKPKACNYAMQFATGEYVVIYDAEDRPDPLQLKKAVVAFRELGDRNVVCLQAKLNFYNTDQNLLTRLFTLEYSLWFDLVLTGLHSISAPIPLGGTSNHFRRENLKLLQGWDPFNVTEDCDLGIRLFKYGYKTRILDSTTWEEANSNFFGWFRQRSRWIKGYIQTYLVHMRRPHEFISEWTNPHLLTFQLIVGGKVLSMWINPLFWAMTVMYFAMRPVFGPLIESLYLAPFFYLAVFSLVFGNFLYFYYYMVGAAKRGQWELVKYAFLIPFYWLMMSVGSWIALYQLIIKPHYWEKTRHGLHLRYGNVV